LLPFKDIKVLDFSQRLPGPYCTSILSDFGAEVTMIERADRVPESRRIFPGLFELLNRNKKSVTINLKTREGQEIVEKLVKKYDVLVEGFRPGVAERIGIGYKKIKSLNPSMIYCSISGFGQNGPYKDRVGHDINYLSLSGVLSIPGQPEVPPSRPGIPIADLASGIFAAISIMGALRQKECTGEGTWIDVSMFDLMVTWTGIRASNYLVHGKKFENEHLSPLNNLYETKDGSLISLGIIEQHFWENFCDSLGRKDLFNNPKFSTAENRKKHERELLEVLRDIIGQYTRDELDKKIDPNKVPYAPLLEVEEVFNDPHVCSREIVKEIEVPNLGKLSLMPFPVKFSGETSEIRRPPPEWGQHTEDILGELGYSMENIGKLKERKVV